jgi:hypothetical protein
MHKTHNTTILTIQNILPIQIQTKKPHRDGEAPAKLTIDVVNCDKTPITPSNHHPMHKTHNTTILTIQNILPIQIQTKKPHRDGEAPAKLTIDVVNCDKTPITPSNHHPMHKTHNTTILPIQNILPIQIQTKKRPNERCCAVSPQRW